MFDESLFAGDLVLTLADCTLLHALKLLAGLTSHRGCYLHCLAGCVLVMGRLGGLAATCSTHMHTTFKNETWRVKGTQQRQGSDHFRQTGLADPSASVLMNSMALTCHHDAHDRHPVIISYTLSLHPRFNQQLV